jgi:polysaccharide biosynthesis/export protein
MTSHFNLSGQPNQIGKITGHTRKPAIRLCVGTCVIAIIALMAGCHNQQPQGYSTNAESKTQGVEHQKTEALTLREGDVIKVSFPGTTTPEAVQTIRRDGKINLALIGEVQAAGLKPTELQAELIKLYAPQLISKEINVSVVSSAFPAFISGAVLRPGKIISDHRITVLEAIMEAGGPDYAKANLKEVVVIRQSEDGKTKNYTINVKLIMEGVQKEPFYLEPSDIVFVPERFAWF